MISSVHTVDLWPPAAQRNVSAAMARGVELGYVAGDWSANEITARAELKVDGLEMRARWERAA